MMIKFINWLSFSIIWSWVASAIFIEISKKFLGYVHRTIKNIYLEIKPFYLSVVIVYITSLSVQGKMLNGWNIWSSFIWLVCWWVYKNVLDDDNRWKKRKKKVLDKVRRLGSRLVVVPNS